MDRTALARVPAGTPQGGRYADRKHDETNLVLVDDRVDSSRIEQARTEAWRAAVKLHAAHPQDSLGRGLARLASLGSRGPVRRSVSQVQLVTAEYLIHGLTAGGDPAKLAAQIEQSADGLLIGLNVEDYWGVSDSDRFDEPGYGGYDWDAIALDLAARWEDRSVEIAGRVVAEADRDKTAA